MEGENKNTVNMEPVSNGSIEIVGKYGNHGFVIVSANRTEGDAAKDGTDIREQYVTYLKGHGLTDGKRNRCDFVKTYNTRKETELSRDIRSMGYVYSVIYNGYNGGAPVDDVYEPLFVVYNRKKDGTNAEWKTLFDFAIGTCVRHGQKSVYVQAPDESPKQYDANGKQLKTQSSKQGKKVKGSSVFDGKYYKPEACRSYVDKIRGMQHGEIFLG